MSRTLEQRLADYATQLDPRSEHAAPETPRVVSIQSPVGSLAHSTSSWRRGAGAVAGAVAVVIAVLLVSVAADDDGRVRTDLADEPGGQTGDAASAFGFYSRQGNADGVVSDYLADRLDASGDALTIERVGPVKSGSTLVTYQWALRDAITVTGGTVILRAGPTDWWDVIEAISDGVSIDAISRTGGIMTVDYTGPEGAPLRVLLQDIGDNVFEEAECTNGQCTLQSVVPDVPIVVRLQRIEDGRAVTLAERRVDPTAVAPGTDDQSGVTTTIAPGSVALSDLAASTAARFMEEVIGDDSVVRSVDTAEPDGALATATVTVQTTNGATVEVSVECASVTTCLAVGVASPGLRVSNDDGAKVIAPTGGFLTITGLGSTGGDPAAGPGEVMVVDARIEGATPLAVELVDSSWLRMDLRADDGRILRYLRPR